MANETIRKGWKIASNDAFYEHEFGNVRVNRSYNNTAKRPFSFARKSRSGFWIGQHNRNFKTATAAMKAAEAYA